MTEKTLEKGSSQIKKICDALKLETLEPAKAEAAKIIQEAQHKAEGIIEDARKQANAIIAEAKKNIEQERNVFHSSLEQAANQSVEALRQRIEEHLFNPELTHLLKEHLADPKVVAKLINAIVASIEKEGIGTDVSVQIPNTVKPEEVNALLLEKVVKKLENQSVTLGEFSGGAKVQIKDRKMTIDITDATVRELLARYARKDFRTVIFGKAS